MNTIRPCRDEDLDRILTIINAAAQAYRDVIPADRWHDPYMSRAELEREIAAGVTFSGCENQGELVGIMGVQPVRDVELIRHAYVMPGQQRSGVGAALIQFLLRRSQRPMLVGTWAAASWAISFYERHGFKLVAPEEKLRLLQTYWTIPDRQVELSVVLAKPPI